MHHAYAGNNITGTEGLIAVDKVGNFVRFYDPKTLQETSSFPGPEQCVHEMAIAPARDKAYIPLYGQGIYGANKSPNNKILEVDLKSQTLARIFDLGDILAPHGMAVAADNTLWVVCDIPDLLVSIDTATGAITGRYDCPGKGAHQMAIAPDGRTVFVSHKEGPVGLFDIASKRFTGTLAVSDRARGTGNGSGSEGIMPSPDGKRLLLIDNARNDLLVFSLDTLELLNPISLRGNILSNPKRSRLAKVLFSPDGQTLAVTVYSAGLVWIIDANNLNDQTPVNIAKGPQGMAFAPDGNALIVSSHDSGLLTAIDLRTKKATAAHDGGSGIEVLCWY